MSQNIPSDFDLRQKESYTKAKQATERKNHDYAVTILKQLVTEVPGHLEARRLLRSNEIIKARSASSFAKSMAGVKVSAKAMKAKGMVNKEPLQALSAIEDALEIDPINEQANNILADAAKALEFYDLVAFAYETIREGKPDDIPNLKKLAQHYMSRREPDKAVKVYDKIVALAPQDGEGQKGQKDAAAMMAQQGGAWEEDKSFRAGLKDANEAKLLEEQGRSATSEEGINLQIEKLSEHYQQNNQDINIVKKLAALYEKKKDLVTALQWYQYAFSLSNNSDPVLEKSIHKIQSAQYEESIRGYEEAIAVAEGDTKAQYEQQLAEIKQQYAQIKLTAAKSRVDKYPNDLEFRYEYGQTLYEAGEHKAAVPELQLALKQPKIRYQAMNMLGNCFWQRRMLDFAEKQFATAADEIETMDDLKKEVIYNLGCVLEESEKKDEALAQFKIIYEVDYQYRDVAERVESSYEN
ncbi:MAG: hypothetical protein AAGA18_07025 [Verrucomicrobiota bacterium]